MKRPRLSPDAREIVSCIAVAWGAIIVCSFIIVAAAHGAFA
ncbi:hypothetical protein [Sphingomonas oryzagri]